MLVTNIRRFVYWLGFRPKQGNIFHSPTLHTNYMFKDVVKNFSESAKKGEAQLKRLDLYREMKYCVICGEELEPLDMPKLDTKECPNGCGSASADIDTDGAPFIAFDRQ